MSTSGSSYHHGDLRTALVSAAAEMLETGEPYSLRAVARRAGVSPAAPYRHFADRSALDAAVAVEGFTDLSVCLTDALRAVPDSAGPVDVVSGLGVAYVSFALRRPALFRLMFGENCGDPDGGRAQASRELESVLAEVLSRSFPEQSSSSLTTALWGLAHGLAFLHLDGEYSTEPPAEIAKRVRAVVTAVYNMGQGLASPST